MKTVFYWYKTHLKRQIQLYDIHTDGPYKYPNGVSARCLFMRCWFFCVRYDARTNKIYNECVCYTIIFIHLCYVNSIISVKYTHTITHTITLSLVIFIDSFEYLLFDGK